MGERPLDHILRHNTWANGAIIEFVRRLDPVAHESVSLGTYGTIERTLQHLIGETEQDEVVIRQICFSKTNDGSGLAMKL